MLFEGDANRDDVVSADDYANVRAVVSRSIPRKDFQCEEVVIKVLMLKISV